MRVMILSFLFLVSTPMIFSGCSISMTKTDGPIYENGALVFVPDSVDVFENYCLFSGTATTRKDSWPDKMLSIGPQCRTSFNEPDVVFVEHDVDLSARELKLALDALRAAIDKNCKPSGVDFVISCLSDAIPRYISKTKNGYRVAYVSPDNIQGQGITMEVFKAGDGFDLKRPSAR